jgi:AraC-like DNA-binding protein
VTVAVKAFQVIDTRDPDEFAAGIAGLVGRAGVEPIGRTNRFRARVRHLALGEVGIFHGSYERGLTARFSDLNMFAGSPAPLRGVGAHEIGGKGVSVSRSRGAVLSPGVVTLRYEPLFEHLSMTVRPAALVGKLAALVGDLRAGPLQFNPAVIASAPQAKRLERLLQFVAAEFDPSAAPMPSIMEFELQQSMITSFLLANANNYSGLLLGEPEAAAPWQVRRAEQFIEANWDQPISIEELARVTNVSARSLFSSFKAGRGCSPMEFVKRVRLGRARQKLSRPDTGTSVTEVAFACGFGNPGHFARDYRENFGETPSETLRRGLGGRRASEIGLGSGSI